MERLDLPGTASIRSQIGIEQEDPAVFHPYRVAEAVRAADVLSGDSEVPRPVRRLLRVGLALDLRPGHLTLTKSELGRRLALDRRTVKARELAWESLDPLLRFELVRRASVMILMWRGTKSERGAAM